MQAHTCVLEETTLDPRQFVFITTMQITPLLEVGSSGWRDGSVSKGFALFIQRPEFEAQNPLQKAESKSANL